MRLKVGRLRALPIFAAIWAYVVKLFSFFSLYIIYVHGS